MSGTEPAARAHPLAALIDHTILKPDAREAEVAAFCDEARRFGFRAVCVNPIHVALVAKALAGSGVRACSVVGFPFGATTPAAKAAETAQAIADGAQEIDMVIAIGALKDGRLDAVRADIAVVRAAARGGVLKVIIETAMLTDEEKRIACRLAKEAGADFVKTATGYGGGGATVEDIALMRAAVGPAMGVKASGGVRTREAAEAMIAAGATRIGTSSGLAIIGESRVAAGSY
ncbi:deoxyribose-phosphate aldolase [Acidisoma sp. C75]